MCGLIAAFHTGKKNTTPVNQFVIDQYEDQHTRGKEGFGIVSIAPGKEVQVDRATEPVKMMLDLYMKPAMMMLFHHRYPTSSDNYLNQTHPLIVEDGSLKHRYLVMHNGVLSNHRELKKTHEELGFVYRTPYQVSEHYEKFNDSESLAIEVARFIEGQITSMGFSGSAAIIALQCDANWIPERVYFGRTSNPLNMSKTRDKLYLSSEGPGNPVDPYKLYSFGVNDPLMKLSNVPFTVLEQKEKERSTASSVFGYDTTRPYKSDICQLTTCTKTRKWGEKYCDDHVNADAVPKRQETLELKSTGKDPAATIIDDFEPVKNEDDPYFEEWEAVNEAVEDFFKDAYYPLALDETDIENTISTIRENLTRVKERSEKQALQDMDYIH
jgi:hypothetical protein